MNIPDTFEVEVTLEHLVDSIYSENVLETCRCSSCILAIAVKPIVPYSWMTAQGVLTNGIHSSEREWTVDDVGKKIIYLFDRNHYNEVEEMLPATVRFERTK